MSHIWVPRAHIIEPSESIASPTRVAGRFRLTAIRPDGRERPLTGWFSNLVLNQGLDIAATVDTWMNACRVGTGNTTPMPGDTNLVAHVAGTTTVQSQSFGTLSTSPYYAWRIRTWRFGQGAAAGNLAEVGVGTSAANGSNLFSRELIRDGSGNPTTVTVLSDEFLDVTYEHRLYPGDLIDVNGNVTISGVSYVTVMRAADCGSNSWRVPYSLLESGSSASAYNGALGPVTGSPSGSVSSGSSKSQAAYTNGSFYRDVTWTWDLNAGNLSGGITAMRIIFGNANNGSQAGASQISFSPAIPKDSTKVLSLTFRRTLARHTI